MYRREREREILKVEINSRTESTNKLHHLDTCHSLANLLTSHYISLKHWGKRNCPHPVRRLHHHSGKPRLLRLSSEEEALQNHCSTIFFLIDPPHWKKPASFQHAIGSSEMTTKPSIILTCFHCFHWHSLSMLMWPLVQLVATLPRFVQATCPDSGWGNSSALPLRAPRTRGWASTLWSRWTCGQDRTSTGWSNGQSFPNLWILESSKYCHIVVTIGLPEISDVFTRRANLFVPKPPISLFAKLTSIISI